MKCAVVSGGTRCHIDHKQYDYIIACDYGLTHCIESGFSPNIAVGDFDSCEPKYLDAVRTIHYRRDKDDTDTMLAVKHAISLGYKDIDILCALGGRLDHTLANIATLVYAVKQGARCRIVDDQETITAVVDSVEVQHREGYSMSVLSYSDSSTVSIVGAEYCLDQAAVYSHVPLGISNIVVGNTAKVTVGSGIVLVVESVL